MSVKCFECGFRGLAIGLILCCFSILTEAQEPAADLPENATLSSVWSEYEAALAAVLKPVKDLDELYLTNLAKLRAEAVNSGKLQQVLAVESAVESFQKGEEANVPADFTSLVRLKEIYRTESAKRQSEVAEATQSVYGKYGEKLLKLQERLTKQEKIAEAIEVGKSLELLKSLAGATPKSGPPMTIGGASTTTTVPPRNHGDAQKTEGSLSVVGKMQGDVEIDLGAANGMSDFIDVTGTGRSWAALRKAGDVVGWNANSGAFSFTEIASLVHGNSTQDKIYAITKTGDLVCVTDSTKIVSTGTVVQAAVGASHGISLLNDGTISVWGNLYDGPVGSTRPFPAVPADALADVIAVAASRYSAWVVKKDGRLIGWGTGERVYEIPKEIRGIVGVSACAFAVYATNSRGDMQMLAMNGGTLEVKPIKESGTRPRSGNYTVIQLVRNNWKQLPAPLGWENPELHGEWVALRELDEASLPFLYQDFIDGKLATSYALWISPKAGGE